MKQSEVVIGGCYLTYICGALAPVIVVEKIEPAKYSRAGERTRYRIRRVDNLTPLSKLRTAAALRPKPAL